MLWGKIYCPTLRKCGEGWGTLAVRSIGMLWGKTYFPTLRKGGEGWGTLAVRSIRMLWGKSFPTLRKCGEGWGTLAPARRWAARDLVVCVCHLDQR